MRRCAILGTVCNEPTSITPHDKKPLEHDIRPRPEEVIPLVRPGIEPGRRLVGVEARAGEHAVRDAQVVGDELAQGVQVPPREAAQVCTPRRRTAAAAAAAAARLAPPGHRGIERRLTAAARHRLRGAAVLLLVDRDRAALGRLPPEEEQRARVPVTDAVRADGGPLQTVDGDVYRAADAAARLAAQGAGQPRLEEEHGGVDDVEVVLYRHVPQPRHGVDEAVQGAEQGVGGVDGLVDEAGVAAAGDVGEERAGFGGGRRRRVLPDAGHGAVDGRLEGEGVDVQAEEVVGEDEGCFDVWCNWVGQYLATFVECTSGLTA